MADYLDRLVPVTPGDVLELFMREQERVIRERALTPEDYAPTRNPRKMTRAEKIERIEDMIENAGAYGMSDFDAAALNWLYARMVWLENRLKEVRRTGNKLASLDPALDSAADWQNARHWWQWAYDKSEDKG